MRFVVFLGTWGWLTFFHKTSAPEYTALHNDDQSGVVSFFKSFFLFIFTEKISYSALTHLGHVSVGGRIRFLDSNLTLNRKYSASGRRYLYLHGRRRVLLNTRLLLYLLLLILREVGFVVSLLAFCYLLQSPSYTPVATLCNHPP